ncbi:MAG: hypothetical protein LWX83_01545 [Anaerolineae bacterium]|nr:hypothetical protein [Anaerolineae bacterium]
MLLTPQNWKDIYPGAVMGLLVLQGVVNPPRHAALEAQKAQFETAVRAQYGAYTRSMLETLPNMMPYVQYYKQFNKNYHVLFQVESVALKGKSLPQVAALVEAMFMVELKNQLLTAGHDLDRLKQPLRLGIAAGDESYTLMNGQNQILKAGDMYVADAEAVISSIIHGPDRRTAITPDTQRVLFVVYAPPGIGAEKVQAHLEDIRDTVLMVSPQAETSLLQCYTA